MPRPTVVWHNSTALERCLYWAASPNAAPDEELAPSRRALEAGAAFDRRRFKMVMPAAFDWVPDEIDAKARRPRMVLRLYLKMLGKADDHGCYMVEADQLAAAARVPRTHLYGALLDLERLGVLSRIMKNRQVRGIQFTRRVWSPPQAKPGRRGHRNGAEHRAPLQ